MISIVLLGKPIQLYTVLENVVLEGLKRLLHTQQADGFHYPQQLTKFKGYSLGYWTLQLSLVQSKEKKGCTQL